MNAPHTQHVLIERLPSRELRDAHRAVGLLVRVGVSHALGVRHKVARVVGIALEFLAAKPARARAVGQRAVRSPRIGVCFGMSLAVLQKSKLHGTVPTRVRPLRICIAQNKSVSESKPEFTY